MLWKQLKYSPTKPKQARTRSRIQPVITKTKYHNFAFQYYRHVHNTSQRKIRNKYCHQGVVNIKTYFRWGAHETEPGHKPLRHVKTPKLSHLHEKRPTKKGNFRSDSSGAVFLCCYMWQVIVNCLTVLNNKFWKGKLILNTSIVIFNKVSIRILSRFFLLKMK